MVIKNRLTHQPTGNANIILIFLLMLCGAGALVYMKRDFITEKMNIINQLPGADTGTDSQAETSPDIQRPVVASAPIQADEAIYNSYANRDDVLVLVDYYADWCPPCRKIAPYLSRLASTHGDKVVVLKVDVDQQETLARRAGVSSIPDVRLLHNGRELKRIVGAHQYDYYKDLVLEHAKRLPPPDVNTAPAEGEQQNTGEPQGTIKPMEKDWMPPGIERAP